MFDVLDTDKSGELDRREFRHVVKLLTKSQAKWDGAVKMRESELLQAFDHHRTGNVMTRADFLAFVMAQEDEMFVRVYGVDYDYDNDNGAVCRHHYMQTVTPCVFVTLASPQQHVTKASKYFKQITAHKRDYVTSDEFRALVVHLVATTRLWRRGHGPSKEQVETNVKKLR